MKKNNKVIIGISTALSLVGVGAIVVSGISMSKKIDSQGKSGNNVNSAAWRQDVLEYTSTKNTINKFGYTDEEARNLWISQKGIDWNSKEDNGKISIYLKRYKEILALDKERQHKAIDDMENIPKVNNGYGILSQVLIPNQSPVKDVATKEEIEEYTKKMNEFNEEQIKLFKDAIAKLHAKKDKGFKSSFKVNVVNKGQLNTKVKIDDYNSSIDKFNDDQITQSKSTKGKIINQNIDSPPDLGFISNKGKEKPDDLGEEPTQTQVDDYNNQMKLFRADQISESKKAVKELREAANEGYESKLDTQMPATKPEGTPTKKQVDAYNRAVDAYNANQAEQLNDALKNIKNPIDRGFVTTAMTKKPNDLSKVEIVTKPMIDAYNKQMIKFNAFQKEQWDEAKKALVPEEDKGFPWRNGYDKPTFNHKSKISDINAYNKQMVKFNNDQKTQSIVAKKGLPKAITNGYSIFNEEGVEIHKPKDFDSEYIPTKKEVDDYTSSMHAFNEEKDRRLLIAKSLLIKTIDNGFTPPLRINDKGLSIPSVFEKPIGIDEIKNKDDVRKYYNQVILFNLYQVEQLSILNEKYKSKIHDLGFTAGRFSKKPELFSKNPTDEEKNKFNKLVNIFNNDQIKQSNMAKKTLISDEWSNLKFPTDEEHRKPKDFDSTYIPTKKEIDDYNAQMKKFNAFQKNTSKKSSDSLMLEKDLGYTPNSECKKPSIFYQPRRLTYIQVITYNAQMKKFNDYQNKMMLDDKKNVVNSKDKLFTPNRGCNMPDALGENLTKKKIEDYNTQMKKFNDDQDKQEKEAYTLVVKPNDKGFHTGDNKKMPEHLNTTATKKQFDAYNDQMRAFNEDQLEKSKRAKQTITKLTNYGFLSVKENKAPTDLGDEPTKREIFIYEKQAEKFNTNQKDKLSIAIKNLIKEKDLGYYIEDMDKASPGVFAEPKNKENFMNKIIDFNNQMKTFNEEQVRLSQIAIKSASKLTNYGFPSENKPDKLGNTPTLKEIEHYNEQAEIFSEEQEKKLKAAIENLTEAKDLGYPQKAGYKIPENVDLTSKAKIDTYNNSMELFNGKQIEQAKEAKEKSTKEKGKGFTSDTQHIKPIFTNLAEFPTMAEIGKYNNEMQAFNLYQKQKLQGLNKEYERNIKDLLFASKKGCEKPKLFESKPSYLQKIEFNKKVKLFNEDQKNQLEKQNRKYQKWVDEVNLGFVVYENNKKVEPPTLFTKNIRKIPTDSNSEDQQAIDDMARKIAIFGAYQENALESAINNLKSVKDLGFTTFINIHNLAAPRNKDEIDAHNIVITSFNTDQREKLDLNNKEWKSKLENADLGFEPASGYEKPELFKRKPDSDKINVFIDKLSLFEEDQLKQLREINTKLLDNIKRVDLHFVPNDGNNAPDLYVKKLSKADEDNVNKQLKLFENDQKNQLIKTNSSLEEEINKVDLNFTPKVGSGKPKLFKAKPNENDMKIFNEKLDLFKSYQKNKLEEQNKPLETKLRNADLGFEKGHKKPKLFEKKATTSEKTRFNQKLSQFSKDQLDQLNELNKPLLEKIKDANLGFASKSDSQKPELYKKNPREDSQKFIMTFYKKLTKYTQDQIKQDMTAKKINDYLSKEVLDFSAKEKLLLKTQFDDMKKDQKSKNQILIVLNGEVKNKLSMFKKELKYKAETEFIKRDSRLSKNSIRKYLLSTLESEIENLSHIQKTRDDLITYINSLN